MAELFYTLVESDIPLDAVAGLNAFILDGGDLDTILWDLEDTLYTLEHLAELSA